MMPQASALASNKSIEGQPAREVTAGDWAGCRQHRDHPNPGDADTTAKRSSTEIECVIGIMMANIIAHISAFRSPRCFSRAVVLAQIWHKGLCQKATALANVLFAGACKGGRGEHGEGGILFWQSFKWLKRRALAT
jgi:hypothetical protein